MEGAITEIGIPALIVVMILREVFSFLRSRAEDKKLEQPSGEKPVEFWFLAFDKIVRDAMKPISDDQRRVLDQLDDLHNEFKRFRELHGK